MARINWSLSLLLAVINWHNAALTTLQLKYFYVSKKKSLQPTLQKLFSTLISWIYTFYSKNTPKITNIIWHL